MSLLSSLLQATKNVDEEENFHEFVDKQAEEGQEEFAPEGG